MPTIAELIVYEVQKINRIPETPCLIAPCGHCQGIHAFPIDTAEIVKTQCPPSGPEFQGRPRSDFHSLIHGGPALRELVLAFETDKHMRNHLSLLDVLHPRELWQEIQTLNYDPTTVPNPFAGDLEAQRQMGKAFDEGAQNLAPLLDEALEIGKSVPQDDEEC